MKQLNGILFALLGVLSPCVTRAQDSPYPEAPGHEDLPVIFWAHYMPQVASGNIHCGGHVGGNYDAFPFQPQRQDRTREMAENMKVALASGINGFQFLTVVPPEFVKAAERVKEETGEMFYVAPEWCDMGDDYQKAAGRIAGFALKYKDNPHISRINGRQVHFLYNQGKWSGSGDWANSDNIPKVQEILKSKGAEVMLIPTVGPLKWVALDIPEQKYRSEPPLQPYKPGEFKWMKETHWDGATALNSTANSKSSTIEEIRSRLERLDRDFVFVPALRTMYDSSNRYWQAIHCRGMGIRVLRRDLKRWTRAGFRQFTFSTWNDPGETMLAPSSRNPWGCNDLIKYYHGITATGKSPFRVPHFVVSYEPEVLLGDQGFFQCLVLPETDTVSCDYSVQVRFEDIHGNEVFTLGSLLQTDTELEDDLAEVRFDTTNINEENSLLVPFVSIRKIDSNSGFSRNLCDGVRLPPIRIRYNKLHYYTPYAISLNHVDTETTLSLTAGEDQRFLKKKHGELVTLTAAVRNNASPIRRLNLSESCLPIGAFRDDDTLEQAGNDKPRVYLRLFASEKTKLVLRLQEGTINEAYTPHWDPKQALKMVGEPETETVAAGFGKVCRILCSPTETIALSLPGAKEPFLTTTVAELAKQAERARVKVGEEEVAVAVVLTTDATDQNLDYPLTTSDRYVRTIPLTPGHTPLRVLHGWALMAGDKIAYSNPVAVLVGGEGVQKDRRVNFIRTHGIFDDFVDDHSGSARNPFTQQHVQSRKLPVWMIPYFKLDLNEGMGNHLNHQGIGHQLGRAWLKGDYEWIEDGWEGSAIRLKEGGKIHYRSKTMPHGSITISMRIKVDKGGETQSLLEDGDYYMDKLSGPIDLRLLENGTLRVFRRVPGGEAEITSVQSVEKGWNHVVVTYDLRALKLFLNGKLEGEAEIDVPTYKRTHSAPVVGFSNISKRKDGQSVGFSGVIDHIEIIGTGLTDDEVGALHTTGYPF